MNALDSINCNSSDSHVGPGKGQLAPELGTTLFSLSRDAILVVRLRDGRILEANPAAEHTYGYPLTELLGLSIHDLQLPGTPDLDWPPLQQTIPSGRMFESQHRRKDGAVFPVEVSPGQTEFVDEQAILCMIRDITERKIAQQALVESESRYCKLVELSPDCIAVHYDGKIAFINPAGTRLLGGLSADELVGKSMIDFIQAENRPRVLERFTQIVQGLSLPPLEEKIIRPDGSFVVGEITATPFTFQGKSAVLLFGRDITKRACAEENLSGQVARLSALRAIDQSILSGMDLKGVLGVLLDKITGLLQVDAADILLYYPKHKILKAAARKGMASYRWEEIVSLSDSHAGWVAQERQMEFLSDLSLIDDPLTQKIRETQDQFISYLAIPLIAKDELKGVLQIFHRSRLEPTPDWIGYLETLAGQAAIAIHSAQLFLEQQQTNTRLTQAYEDTIDGWSRALDLRDRETQGHSQRVTDLTLELARRLGVSKAQQVHIRRGAQLHDIGKLGIPDSILLKPGKLTEEEWERMHQHPTLAADLLYPIEFLSPALEIPYGHHEKWDGTGYPQGLSGKEIPFSARIFAVVDVWDALTSDRPYRRAWPKQAALDYIREQGGKHFDPKVVEAFLDMISKWNPER